MSKEYEWMNSSSYSFDLDGEQRLEEQMEWYGPYFIFPSALNPNVEHVDQPIVSMPPPARKRRRGYPRSPFPIPIPISLPIPTPILYPQVPVPEPVPSIPTPYPPPYPSPIPPVSAYALTIDRIEPITPYAYRSMRVYFTLINYTSYPVSGTVGGIWINQLEPGQSFSSSYVTTAPGPGTNVITVSFIPNQSYAPVATAQQVIEVLP